MQVLVVVFEDKHYVGIYPLKVETSDTIFSVKVQMYAINGVRPDESYITKFYDSHNKELEDSCTLSDYGIQKDDRLTFALKK